MRTLSIAIVLAALVGCGDSGGSMDAGGTDGGGLDSGGSPDSGGVDSGTTDSGGGDGGGSAYCPVVGYVPCGGDLVGTWAFRDLCPEDPEAAAALCEHPYDDRPVCTGPGNEAVCDGTHVGTLVFHEDGTIDIETMVTVIATWGFTDDCLAAVATGATPEERCASMNSDRLTCTYEGACSCVGDPIVETDMNTATYTVMGNEVVLGADPPSTYCIDGDILTMDYYVFHPVSWRYWVLERQ